MSRLSLSEEEIKRRIKLLESIDMTQVWKDYAKSVRKHLDKNKRVRLKSRENPKIYP